MQGCLRLSRRQETHRRQARYVSCLSNHRAFDAFLEQHGLAAALTNFVIPRESVARIRDQLEIVSVDERRLCPDLDGVAAAIRHYYG